MKSPKSYPVTAFKLWKNDGKKWYSYNHVFDSVDRNSYDYMRASKMMLSGWIPYAIAMIPGKHDPLKLDVTDYTPLDEMLAEKDPIGVIAGKAIKEFLHRLPVDARKTPRSHENRLQIHDRALTVAIEAYRRGEFVPQHLLKDVLKVIGE